MSLVIMHAVIPMTAGKYLYRAAFFSTSPLNVEGCLALHCGLTCLEAIRPSAASLLVMESQVLEGGHDLVQKSSTFLVLSMCVHSRAYSATA